jgi:hypothetical protein
MKSVSQVWRLAVCCAAALLPAVTAATAASPAAAAGDRPNLTPGNWEMTITSDIPNMPSRPAMTTTHCVKADDVKDTHTFAAAMQQRNGKCVPSDFKFDGGKLSYTWACDGGESGSTEFLFAGATYEGTTKVNMPAHGNRAAMSITQHIKAKRVGDC